MRRASSTSWLRGPCAWMAGLLGGGTAESAFCEAAVALADGKATNADEVRAHMGNRAPDDTAFRRVFTSFGAITTTRAKHILARPERQRLAEKGESTEAMPDWSIKGVSVEHIFARSTKRETFETDDDFDRFASMRDQLQNLTLLERTLNAGLEDKPFSEKRATYGESAFCPDQRAKPVRRLGFRLGR
jgi:hypothetical protein